MGLRGRIEGFLSPETTALQATANRDSSEVEHRRVLSSVLSQVDERLHDPTSITIEALQPSQIRDELKARQLRIHQEQLICSALHKRLREIAPYDGPTRWQMRED